jgi:putative transposase
MPRTKRIWVPGDMYHITARGNHKNNLFRDRKDYHHYLALLQKVIIRYLFHLHSYCLMPNHIHLIIGTIDHSPSSIMHYLHSVYARYYSKPIRNHKQLLDTSAYVHLNPVKANYTKLAEEYPWSSYSVYVKGSSTSLVHIQLILLLLGEDPRQKYKLYVETRRSINDWKV